MNILISGVGGPTPKNIARSIKISRYAHEAKLFGTELNPLKYGLYEKDLYEKTAITPHASKACYWESIEGFINQNDITCAIVQPEQEVLAWAKHKREGGSWPCKALIPDYDVVKVLVNKGRMTEMLKDSGFVPKSLIFSPKELHIEELEAKFDYPFWVRSTCGSSGLASLKVTSRESLETWLNLNGAIDEFIASTYLPGRNLACKLLFHRGELLRAACGERVNYIMANTAPSKITGNTAYGRLLNEPKVVAFAAEVLELVFQKTGAEKHGFFTVDIKEDEYGKPFITEINVRMVAFNLSFAQGGANFSEDILQLLQDEEGFDRSFKIYEFKPGTIFLRDVDSEPILMNESQIKSPFIDV